MEAGSGQSPVGSRGTLRVRAERKGEFITVWKASADRQSVCHGALSFSPSLNDWKLQIMASQAAAVLRVIERKRQEKQRALNVAKNRQLDLSQQFNRDPIFQEVSLFFL